MMAVSTLFVQRLLLALHRARLAWLERRIRRTEAYVENELVMHAEQMLWLRTELQSLRAQRLAQARRAATAILSTTPGAAP